MKNTVFLEFPHTVIGKPGPVTVQFNYDLETKEFINLVIHSSWGTGLPTHPQLVWHNEEYQFCLERHEEKDGQTIITKEYFNDQLSKDLIAGIWNMVEEYTPRFT